VLEPAVFGGWVDPPGTLKLVNLAETLHPRGVDEVLFGLLTGSARRRKRYIAMDRVAKKGCPIVEFFTAHEFSHGIIIPVNAPESI
jgi:hypothetical protein